MSAQWILQTLLLGGTLGLVCIPGATTLADGQSELDDAAARTQYAFYTGDTRALDEALRLLQGLANDGRAPSLASMQQYFSAYANWKLAQLYSEAATAGRPVPRGSAAKAAQACGRHAQAALTLDKRMAEVQAIEAICSSYAGSLIPGGGGGCERRALRAALEQQPQNPRIRLIELLCQQKAEANSVAREQKLRELVASFEMAPPEPPGKPDWGQAEALLLLGESHLQRGDLLAARDVIERALVIAPDYRRAQELLQTAAARPK